jgi:hypothetical protein
MAETSGDEMPRIYNTRQEFFGPSKVPGDRCSSASHPLRGGCVAKTTLCALIPHQRYKAASRVAESYCLGSLIRNTFVQHARRLRTCLQGRPPGHRRPGKSPAQGPAASESSRRRPPVAAGTGRNFTRPWNSSRKGMCWSFGSSTDFPGL